MSLLYVPSYHLSLFICSTDLDYNTDTLMTGKQPEHHFAYFKRFSYSLRVTLLTLNISFKCLSLGHNVFLFPLSTPISFCVCLFTHISAHGCCWSYYIVWNAVYSSDIYESIKVFCRRKMASNMAVDEEKYNRR